MKLKIAIAVLLACVIAVSAAAGQKKRSSAGHMPVIIPAEIAAAAHSAVATGCDAELWSHVYHKARLHVVEKCIAVTGTIHHIKREADGDDHIQLSLDSDFAGLLNEKNKSAQADSLVIEPVCQGAVTQPDAMAACRDFHSPITIPAKGDKVRVVGSFVLDAEAGHGWMEIHPVSSIEGIH